MHRVIALSSDEANGTTQNNNDLFSFTFDFRIICRSFHLYNHRNFSLLQHLSLFLDLAVASCLLCKFECQCKLRKYQCNRHPPLRCLCVLYVYGCLMVMSLTKLYTFLNYLFANIFNGSMASFAFSLFLIVIHWRANFIIKSNFYSIQWRRKPFIPIM